MYGRFRVACSVARELCLTHLGRHEHRERTTERVVCIACPMYVKTRLEGCQHETELRAPEISVVWRTTLRDAESSAESSTERCPNGGACKACKGGASSVVQEQTLRSVLLTMISDDVVSPCGQHYQPVLKDLGS